MKFIPVFFCFIFMFSQHSLAQGDFECDYEIQYKQALEFVRNNKNLIKETFSGSNISPSIAISLVFPEMVRYNALQDLIETKTLELLYTQYGKAYANFSIGNFQMKPGWAEKIEQYVVSYNIKSALPLSQFPVTDSTEIRKIRLERLTNLTWQLKYLKAFIEIITIKNKPIPAALPDKIRFFASAYNLGFTTTEDIKEWQKAKGFPNGVKSKYPQYSYGEISLSFYQKYSSTIFQ